MELFGSFQALGIEGGTLLMFVMLLGLLVTGIPLAYVTLLVALIFALGWFGPMAVPLITSRVYSFVSSFVFVSVPMFVLMAAILDRSGIARDLFDAMKLVGGQWQRVSWEQAIEEIGDKLGANLKLVFGTPFSPLVPIALIALIWIVAKPTSKPGAALDVALRSVPFARETLIGLLVLWTVGFAMNDSGLALLLNGIGLALPLAMTLAAHRLRRDQDHTNHI